MTGSVVTNPLCEEMVDGAKRGDDVSVNRMAEELDRQHRKGMMKCAISAGLSYHKAEDAANRTLWVFCKKLPSFHPVRKGAAVIYLFRIHRFVCKKLASKRIGYVEPLPSEEMLPPSREVPAVVLELREAIERQPLRRRQVLLLKIAGYTFREIAEKLDSCQATVASWYYKTVRRLRDDLVAE